jgi:hypothetical protein
MVNQCSQQHYANPPELASSSRSINLIKSDLAIRGIDKKFAAKPMTKTSSFKVYFALQHR